MVSDTDSDRESADQTTGLPLKRKFHYTRSKPMQKRTCLIGDAVDMHAIWYSRAALEPSTNGNTAFRKELAKSYLGLIDGMHGTPANMQAHLWTDRKSLHALYTPVVQANGVEIEIPHSMIDHRLSRVKVQQEPDLLAMLDAIEDDTLRQDLKKLYFHPARVNIGFLADVIRVIVTQAHARRREFFRRMNVYTDRDSMADVALQRDHEAAGGEGDPPEGLDAAKLSIRAMAKTPPAVPDATVPEEIQTYGYALNCRENDILAAVPGAKRSKDVVRKMLRTANAVKYTRPSAREKDAVKVYTEGIQQSIAYFRSLRSGRENEPPPTHTDPEEALSAFALAERVRALRPELQKRIDDLEATARDTMDDGLSERCIVEAAALRSVYGRYNEHTEHFVNLCTYLPQTSLQIVKANDALFDFYQGVFNAVPRVFDSESGWKGELRSTLPDVDGHEPSLKEQIEAHDVILGLLKAQPSREI